MAQTYVRNIDASTIDRINGSVDDVATSNDYLRPLALAAPLGLFVMSLGSFKNIQDVLYTPLNQNRIARAFGGDESENSVANKSIAALPYTIAFPGLRGGKDWKIKSQATEAGFNSMRGIRRVSLQIKPINDDEYCPLEFKKYTEEIGATDFYEAPSGITIGWTVLETQSEVMQERREQILEGILSATPFLLLDQISIGE